MLNDLLPSLTYFFPTTERKQLKPIHVIGNGWASYHFIKNLDETKYYPIIISPNERVLNTTKLVSFIDNIDEILYFERSAPNKGQHIKQWVTNIYPDSCLIQTDNNQFHKYETLVLAYGSEVSYFGIHGADINAVSLKTSMDAAKIQAILKSQMPKSATVVGAGPTGVETAFQLASKGIKTTLVDALPDILPGFRQQTKEEISNQLKKSNIELFTGEKVTQVYSNEVKTDKKIISSDVTLWTAGVCINGKNNQSIYNNLKKYGKVEPRGLEVSDTFLFSKNIYAIGDVVANKGPPTAQNARNHGVWLANYLNQNKCNVWRLNNPFEILEIAKILHFNDKLYLESKFYTGYLPKSLDPLIQQMYKI